MTVQVGRPITVKEMGFAGATRPVFFHIGLLCIIRCWLPPECNMHDVPVNYSIRRRQSGEVRPEILF
jgi:hypothetical protein